MKTLALTLTVTLFLITKLTIAGSNTTTYSHMPLELKEVITSEIVNNEVVTKETFYGNVWVEFHLDGNREIHVTGLSSDNLMTGIFITEIFKELPRLSEKLPMGKTYFIKLRISHTF